MPSGVNSSPLCLWIVLIWFKIGKPFSTSKYKFVIDSEQVIWRKDEKDLFKNNSEIEPEIKCSKEQLKFIYIYKVNK